MQYGECIKGVEWLAPGVIEYQGIKTKVTPWIEQFIDAKKENPGAILFFRMGDFYETFFDDAKVVSQALDLTLTARSKNDEGIGIPMAGVPFRAVNEYLYQMVEKGFKVAICEQLEDPATAAGKVVKRGVTQIVTPGTLCDERPGVERSSRFLTALVWSQQADVAPKKRDMSRVLCGIASLDLSTGYCTMTELRSLHALQSELLRMNVREVVTHHSGADAALEKCLCGISVTYRDRDMFSQDALIAHWMTAQSEENAVYLTQSQFLTFVDTIERTAFESATLVCESFCGLLMYLRALHYPLTANIEQIYPYLAESYMQIDAATFQNLEIYATLRGAHRTGALLGEIDDTVTGPGSRLLQTWLAYPLKDIARINERQSAVEALFKDYECRDALRSLLKSTCDLERIATKIANGRVSPHEFVLLHKTLALIPDIIARCRQLDAPWFEKSAQRLVALESLKETLENALIDDAPNNLNDTNFFKPGYDEKLDHFRDISQNGQQWLLDYEQKQRQETGIGSLKVKYQRNFGYFIEVTKANLSLVPDSYKRSQTLVNCERFYTTQLREYEEELMSSESEKSQRELELYDALKRMAGTCLTGILQNARTLAQIDVIASFAHTAHHRQYTKPMLDDSNAFSLRASRHPVVERCLPKGERFVPNDIEMNQNGSLMIITGPNMAGKSTVIRQAAIIALMAQMGSFVPAESAHIGIIDRIFSRVGASDNLALGQSTFMVEMTETANILNHATAKSLVILDEIGRGTSTYDGLSLAWAIAEFLHNKIGARALFATHYHELTELENVLPNVKNTSIAVKEYKGDIIFLRKLVNGAANRSYGIQVAKLAGIPSEVLNRAQEMLETLEQNAHRELVSKETSTTAQNEQTRSQKTQRSLFGPPEPTNGRNDKSSDLIAEISSLALDAMTPIQALNWLYKWQKKLR